MGTSIGFWKGTLARVGTIEQQGKRGSKGTFSLARATLLSQSTLIRRHTCVPTKSLLPGFVSSGLAVLNLSHGLRHPSLRTVAALSERYTLCLTHAPCAFSTLIKEVRLTYLRGVYIP